MEAYQVGRVLAGLTVGWRNHPAVLMWRNYEGALNEYGRAICDEWIRRGFVDNMRERFLELPVIRPAWLGDARLHLSHQSNLIRKYPEHYKQHFPEVADDIPYFWVTKEITNG